MILSVEECWDAFFFFFFSCLFVFSEHSNSRRRHALKKEDKTFLYKKRFPCASIRIHKSQRLRRSSWRLRFEPLLRRTGPVEIPPIWNLGWSLSRSIWAKGMWGLANSSTFLFFFLWKGFWLLFYDTQSFAEFSLSVPVWNQTSAIYFTFAACACGPSDCSLQITHPW